MLTETTRLGMGKFFKLGHSYRIFPLKWDKSTGKLSADVTLCSSRQWKVQALLGALSAFFQVTQRVIGVLDATKSKSSSKSVTGTPLDLLFMSVYISTSVLQYLTYKKRHDIANCINHYTEAKEDQRKVRGKLTLMEKLSELTVLYCWPAMWSSTLFVSLLFLKSPNASRYLYSCVPEENRSMWLFSLAAICEYLLMFRAHYYTFFSLILIVTYVVVARASIAKIRVSMSWLKLKESHPFQRLHLTLKIIRDYNLLKLSNNIFNCTFGERIIPVILTSIKIYHGLCIYVAVKLHDVNPVPTTCVFVYWSVLYLLFELVILLEIGQIHAQSKLALETLRSIMPRSHRRYSMHLQPVGMGKGLQFYQKEAALHFFMIISKMTKNVLIIS